MVLPLCEIWFESESAQDGVIRIIEPHAHPLLRSNAYVVRGRDRDLLIDTGNGIGSIAPVVAGLREDPAKPLLVIATHGHIDHSGGLSAFEDRQAHELDAAAIENLAPLIHGANELGPIAEAMAEAGFPLTELLVTAAPHAFFDPDDLPSLRTTLTRTLVEADLVDLGDRAFEILHLPGHTPGASDCGTRPRQLPSPETPCTSGIR